MKVFWKVLMALCSLAFVLIDLYCLIYAIDYGMNKGDYLKGVYYGVGAVYASVAVLTLRYNMDREEQKEKEKEGK